MRLVDPQHLYFAFKSEAADGIATKVLETRRVIENQKANARHAAV